VVNVEISGWMAPGQKDSIRIRNVKAEDEQALRAALTVACEGDGADRTLLWELPRRPEPIRMAARISLGLTCLVGVLLLLAAFVAGAETRSTLLIALALVVVFGGGFPLVVARGDRGVKVFSDGTLERADWGGVSTFDLRRYERVTLH
jgi:VIT1/CCC1 family predicted Fe2+/Mn2+ transporter